jgi:ABC-type transport system involved in cytochrome c biogenesis permease subunit
MQTKSATTGRWIAAILAMVGLAAVFYNLIVDNSPKGELRQIEGYVPWDAETLAVAESIPIQNGGRIKPLSSYAGFTMLGVHGARSMKIEDGEGNAHRLKPTAWLMDSLFRPQMAVQLPTFRVDNSDVLRAAGIDPRGRRDRYSYNDIDPGREKLIELAKSYEAIDKDRRDPVQQQTIDLAYNIRNYETLLGYFGFARFGVTLTGSGGGTQPDTRTDLSTVMGTAPIIREQLAQSQSQGQQIDPRIQGLLEQVLDAANFAKFGLVILPPAEVSDSQWKSAGNAIMDVMTEQAPDPALFIADIKTLETTARSLANGEPAFRTELVALRDRLVKRAENRGEYRAVPLEATYYRLDLFMQSLVLFLIGTLSALAMWTLGKSRAAGIFKWITVVTTSVGLLAGIVAIVMRSVIMLRPPVGNLYDTIIFIGITGVFLALVVEWMVGRRFSLGIAPILGLALIVLARRYEVGDASDHMDPLVAVLDSNFWLTTHVITITLGYSAGLLAAFLSCIYLLGRGLGLDNGDRDFRRSFSRAVYGMICLTLFLSLVGTVLGGIWANYSWGRFWGWDPKENGALMIVIWTLAILHARLGGYIKEWGLHLSSIFTAIIVAFSWWHVNFLGVGLHNYGFTAGKSTIWVFYIVMCCVIGFGFIARALENHAKRAPRQAAPKEKDVPAAQPELQ